MGLSNQRFIRVWAYRWRNTTSSAGDFAITETRKQGNVMTEGKQNSPFMQQIGMLNLRINDMMTQLNAVMKTMMDENAAVKKENAELKEKAGKS